MNNENNHKLPNNGKGRHFECSLVLHYRYSTGIDRTPGELGPEVTFLCPKEFPIP